MIQLKYNTAGSILYTVLLTSDTRNAKVNPTLAAGDAQISKDGGAWANLATLPDCQPASDVQVRVQLSQAETSCKVATIRFRDQTSPAEWDEQYLQLSTYGNASAFMVFDFSQATPNVNVASMSAGAIASSSFAAGAINASAIASSAIVAGSFAAGALDAVWSTATRQLTGTQSFNLTGNITGNLSGSVGSVTGNVSGNVTGSVASVVGNVGGNVAGSVASVTAAVNINSNSDITAIKAKTDNLPASPAAVGSAMTLAANAVDASQFTQAAADKVWSTTVRQLTGTQAFNLTGNITGNISGSVGSVSGNVSGNVTGSVGSVVADVGITQAAADKVWLTTVRQLTGTQTFNLTGNITGNLSGSVGSVTADVGITQASADKVWGTTTRQLTGAQTFNLTGNITGNLDGNVTGSVGSVTADVGITQVGADKVWSTTSRSITDKSGFRISGTKQTLDALNDITAADVWGYATRTLTSGGGITTDANLVSINGQLTNGHNATLYLKKLDIENTTAEAVRIVNASGAMPALNIMNIGAYYAAAILSQGGDGVFIAGAASGASAGLRCQGNGFGAVFSGAAGSGGIGLYLAGNATGQDMAFANGRCTIPNVQNANVTAINGYATNDHLATLYLKSLDIENSGGNAIRAISTAAGYAAVAIANSNATSGKGLTIYSNRDSAVNIQGYINGIEITGGTGYDAFFNGGILGQTNLDKTGYALTSAYDAAKTAAQQSTLTAGIASIEGTIGSISANVISILDDTATIKSLSQQIVAVLPSSGTISNLALTDAIDGGVSLKDVLTGTLAMSCGRFKKDYPTSGQVTFYKRNDADTAFVVNVTDTERTRI